MNRTLLALVAVAALVAVPALASASEGDAAIAIRPVGGSSGSCSDEPYYREIPCRVNQALCALLCPYEHIAVHAN